MVNKVSRTDKISFFLLKVMYCYAKAFSIAHFTIRPGDKPKLIYSIRKTFISIGFRMLCLIVHAALLPGVLKDVGNKSSPRTSIDNFLPVVLIIQFLTIAVFTVALIIFHVSRHKEFVNVVNRTIDIFIRMSKLAGEQHFFTIDFNLMVLFRLLFTVQATLQSVPQLCIEFLKGNYVLVLQGIVELYLWIGTLIVLDTCFVGYVTFAAIYKNIISYMTEFEGRLERDLMQTMQTMAQKKRKLRVFSKQLEKCTVIYAETFKVVNNFHALFQFNFFYTFYIDLVSVIILAHYMFWMYLIKHEILFQVFFVASIRAIEVLFLIVAADTAVRRSRTLKYLNLDNLCSDIDPRWDRAVEQFLNILRFQDLRIRIYGLFQLDNELCLRVLSFFVAFLTILFQFVMLGYFHEEDYVFDQNKN